MRQYETLKTEKQGKVVVATLHRPDDKNAINMQMVNELADLMDRIEDLNDVSVLVLKGNEDAFSCGMDFHAFTPGKKTDVHGFNKWEKMCRQLERLNKFTVAAVLGECTGGGLQLLLTCDARIAGNRASFTLNEVKQGFLPGMATFRLAKFVGLGRAKDLVLTGRTLKAEEARDWGILDRVCEPAELDQAVKATVEDLLPLHPAALEMARRLLTECYENSYENFIGHFLAAQHRAINDEMFQKTLAKVSD